MPPPDHDGYPTRDDVLDYLTRYEERYHLPVRRPARVTRVQRCSDHLEIDTSSGRFAARHVISATGTWSHPYIPDIAGRDLFQGTKVHSARYVRSEEHTSVLPSLMRK